MATLYVSSLADGTRDGSQPTNGGAGVGPWTLAQARAATPAAGDEIRIMADGTYVQTATWTCAYANGTAAANVVITGANSSGAVDGTRATIQLSGSTLTALLVTGSSIRVEYLVFDGASQTASTGLYLNNSYTKGRFCKAINCTSYGLRLGGSINQAFLLRCEATACSGTTAIDASSGRVMFCESYANTTHGFLLNANSFVLGCFACGNTGSSVDGFNKGTSVGYFADRCIAYGNGRAGFDLTGNAGLGSHLSNCVAYGNGGEGYRSDAVKSGAFLLNCAGGSNTAGNYNATNLVNVDGFVSLSADPFVNAASGNFAPNTTAGGGEALKETGFPGVMPRGTTTGYASIGIEPHEASGGGGVSGLPLGRLLGGI